MPILKVGESRFVQGWAVIGMIEQAAAEQDSK